MTVSTTTSYQTFAGGQQTLTFNFRTLVSNPNYVGLSVTNLTTNSITVLTYNVSYSVIVNSTGVGGTVTVSPSYSTGYQYTVFRSTGLVQSSAYANFNQFPASTLENGLDQLTMIAQEITTNQGLTLSLPLGLSPTASTVLPTPVANNALGWNNSGTGLVNLNLVTQGTMVLASATDASGGVQSTHYMTPSTNTIQMQANITNSTGVIITTNSTQVILSALTVTSSTTGISVTTNSTQYVLTLGNSLGVWTSVSWGTIYQSPTDGFLVANGNCGGNGTIYGYTDSTTSASTLRLEQSGANGQNIGYTLPVKKNDYYKALTSGTISLVSLYFISLGS
jgi:hypothetical protein